MTDKLIENSIQKPIVKEFKVGSFVRCLNERVGAIGIVTASYDDCRNFRFYKVKFGKSTNTYDIPDDEVEEINPKEK